MLEDHFGSSHREMQKGSTIQTHAACVAIINTQLSLRSCACCFCHSGLCARRSGQRSLLGRGIDFKGVRTVLNVEPPSSVAGYVHRVGRTGRAGQAGCAISLLDPRADAGLLAELQAQLLGSCLSVFYKAARMVAA